MNVRILLGGRRCNFVRYVSEKRISVLIGREIGEGALVTRNRVVKNWWKKRKKGEEEEEEGGRTVVVLKRYT